MALFDEFPRGAPNGAPRVSLLATAAWSPGGTPWREGQLWLGRDCEGQAVGYGDDRHAVLIAGSRSGKGRSSVIPNLFLWPGSCVVIDPKGENASVTGAARARRAGHKVAVLDPLQTAKVPEGLRASFNPLDLIDAEDDAAIDLAAAIGDAVMIGSGDGKDIHWNESARQIFEAVLLHVAVRETGARRSLVRVRQLLTLGDPDYADILTRLEQAADPEALEVSPFAALWSAMSHNEAVNDAVRDVIAGAANSIREMGDNERGSVLSTARRNTKFIDSTWMRRCLEGHAQDGTALDIDALKAAPGGVSVYVCLPVRFIPTHARFLRLILNLMLFRMEAQGLDKPACGHPVLFVLDEFAALGRLEAIEKAAGLVAGYGVKLFPILQDLGQLKRHYRESWETFLGNAGVLLFFANSDMTTLDWLSKRMGQVEVMRETQSVSTSTTTSLGRSQGRSETSGWSNGTGTTEGQSDMPDLQLLAARDGGSSLMPFLARAGASGVGHSSGRSVQEGRSGGESQQTGETSSSGKSESRSTNEGIHLAALLTPDEIARLFDRSTGRQIVFIDSRPVTLTRTNYDQDRQFEPQRRQEQEGGPA